MIVMFEDKLMFIDALPATAPVIAVATDYPPQHFLPMHQHDRAQLLYAIRGVMQVKTSIGTWVVPPTRAVWIPPQMQHAVVMTRVRTRSLYIKPGLIVNEESCRVLEISALLRELIVAATSIPFELNNARDQALITLLLHEISGANTRSFHLPLPQDPQLIALCEAFIAAPSINETSFTWAQTLHMSERSFSRFFQRELGLTFSKWRERALLIFALSQLAEGLSITRIAFDLGYQSSAAFSAMFRKSMGYAPSNYDNMHDGAVELIAGAL